MLANPADEGEVNAVLTGEASVSSRPLNDRITRRPIASSADDARMLK